MFDPGPCVYMEKIAVGPECVGAIDITKSATENLRAVAKAKGESVRDVTAVILDRPRHEDADRRGPRRRRPHPPHPRRRRRRRDLHRLARLRRRHPARHRRHPRGRASRPRRMKCMGGEQQGRLWPRNDEERAAAVAAGYDLAKVLTTDDLVAGDNCFFSATGITDGELLKGVHYDSRGRHHRSRSSCARSPAPSAWSTPATASPSSATTPTSTSSNPGPSTRPATTNARIGRSLSQARGAFPPPTRPATTNARIGRSLSQVARRLRLARSARPKGATRRCMVLGAATPALGRRALRLAQTWTAQDLPACGNPRPNRVLCRKLPEAMGPAH